MPPSNVIDGPRVATWRCSSCQESVPRLLPNGENNRIALSPERMALPDTTVQQACERVQGLRAPEICYACDQAYQELLGTLVRPPAELGDARGEPGLNDTGIIGALLPIADQGTQILIFNVINEELRCTEIERLISFNPDRLTYPGSRGAIAPRIWALYEDHLAQLHARAPTPYTPD
ncbi:MULTISPECIES: hypothetical protein [unclassified Thioalkalivibrio]|uniref:hypothetical protein n=1 Tax=unclassified Thioalkalivibrio TaxID=2621013 RepID=UPI0003809ADB|nr:MULTISPECIES: hypothetical protein [unclassified Thioalkalivibrio]